MYTFTGKIINAIQAYEWLKFSSSSLSSMASICSAYTKKNILEKIYLNIQKNQKARVLVRWELNDLVSGASDLEAYLYCKEVGWDFYINNNSHVKIYSFPPSGILVGSANATNSGLGISNDPNIEAGTVVADLPENIFFIENLFKQSVLMTDELFLEMKKCLESVETSKDYFAWPDSIFDQIKPNISLESKFLMSDLLRSNGLSIISKKDELTSEDINDLSLLSIYNKDYSDIQLALRLKRTHLFLWLNLLLESLGGEIYFGRLTSELHNALIEDPAPYRSEIKHLIANIYSWVELLGPDLLGLSIDQPNHSQRLYLA